MIIILAIQYKMKISHDLHWEYLICDSSANVLLILLLYEKPYFTVYMVNDRDIAWQRQV